MKKEVAFEILAGPDPFSQDNVKRLLTFINNLDKNNDDQLKVQDDLVASWNRNCKNGHRLDPQYFKKAFNYLMAKHVDKKGFLIPLSPFRSVRDIYVLSTMNSIEILELKDFGTPFKKFYLPVCKAIGKDGKNFTYVIFKGRVEVLSNKNSEDES